MRFALLMAMKIAISIWDGRVSPVLDVAKRLLVLEVEGGRETARSEADLVEADISARARRILELGADVLICGAISRPLEALLIAGGVRVLPQTCGPVEDVLRAFLAGQLPNAVFLMPGCCGRRQRHRAGRYRGGHCGGGF